MKQARTIARQLLGERALAALEARGLRVVHDDTKAARAAEALAGDTVAAADAEREACRRIVADADTLKAAHDAIRARGAS